MTTGPTDKSMYSGCLADRDSTPGVHDERPDSTSGADGIHTAGKKRGFHSAFLEAASPKEYEAVFALVSLKRAAVTGESFSRMDKPNKVDIFRAESPSSENGSTSLYERLKTRLRRPPFLRNTSLTKNMRKRAAEKNQSLPEDKNLSELGKSRSHRLSFHDIREHVISAILEKNPQKVEGLIKLKLPYQPNTKETIRVMELYEIFIEKLRLLPADEDPSENRDFMDACRALLSELNSCEGNLELGDGRINSSISSGLDLNVVRKKNGHLALTPFSKKLNRMSWEDKEVSKPRFVIAKNKTPRLQTSKFVEMEKGHEAVSLRLFSPQSQRDLLQNIEGRGEFPSLRLFPSNLEPNK